jgi:TonB family protein
VPPPVTTTTAPAPVAESAVTAPVVPQPPAIDPTAVDQEVQKRLAAERAKFEEQLRQRQLQQQAAAAAQPATPILQRVQPQPQPPPVIVQQPVVTPTLTPAPQPVVQAPAPAPQPAVVEVPKTKEGDLITSGSEDVPARMLRRASVPYPPLARLQRVQGTVLISALISETGRVLDLKVIRAIGKPVGLNEAAMQIVRGSTFSPPMKDGVHVKSWTTVPVDFKL